MNKRIRELAIQAGMRIGFDLTSDEERTYLRDNNIDKFAQLIVRACMDMVIAHEDDAPAEFHELWLHMKEHFGVEE
jgi:hypothetical protein